MPFENTDVSPQTRKSTRRKRQHRTSIDLNNRTFYDCNYSLSLATLCSRFIFENSYG